MSTKMVSNFGVASAGKAFSLLVTLLQLAHLPNGFSNPGGFDRYLLYISDENHTIR